MMTNLSPLENQKGILLTEEARFSSSGEQTSKRVS